MKKKTYKQLLKENFELNEMLYRYRDYLMTAMINDSKIRASELINLEPRYHRPSKVQKHRKIKKKK